MSDELVNFEPAKNSKTEVVIGGISFLCDDKREGIGRAISILLTEAARLHNLVDNTDRSSELKRLVEVISREWVNDPMSDRFSEALHSLEDFAGIE